MFNLPPGGGTYTLLETISATDAKRTTVQRVLASLPPSLSNGAGTPISKTATSIIGEPSLLGTTDCLMENHSSNGSRISSFTLIAKTSRSQDSRQLEKIRHEYRILRHVHTEYNNRRQPHVKSQQHQDISIGHLTTYNFEKSLHADSNYWQPSRPTLTRSLSRRGFSHPTAETATLAAGDDPTAEDQTFSSVQRKATSKSSDDSPGSSVRQSVGDCPSGENGESESGMDDSFSENSPVRGRPSRVESSTAGSSRRTSVNGLGRINRNSFGGLNGIKIGDASEPHWGHPSIVKPYALLDGKSQNFAAPFGSATGALSVSDTTFFTQSNLGGSNPGIGVGPVLLLYDFGGISLRQYLIERGIRVGPDWITSSSFADRRRGSRDGSARESSNSNSARALPEEHDLYRLSVEDVLSIARQLGHALETVHRANVIHKDINPENIIIRMREDAEETSFFSKLEIQLIDFNLAEIVFDIPTDGRQVDVGKRVLSPTSTLTSTPSINSNNGLHGTLSYMSPEQTGRIQRPVDYRSDFYSLGITLWELFVGKPPFQFDDAMVLCWSVLSQSYNFACNKDYVHAHITKEIEPLDSMLSLMPSFLSKVISKLVSKSPDARYQSASGFLSDIDACLQRIAQFRKEHKIPNDQKLSDEQAFLAMNGRFSKVNGSETRRRSLLPSPEDCVDQNSLMASDFEPPRGIRESYCISNEGKDHEDSQATRQASLQSSHLREDFDESDVATSPLPAEPGTKDFARKIVMPKKATFGRAEEVKFLEDILEEACRPYEKMKMVHVIGEAGSGKSHLITKFKAFVTQKNGILDPNPIAVFQEIISDVMQQLMTKSNETIEQCAAALTKKLSPHDEAVMLQFLPSTALLLKTKPNSIVKSTLTDNERAIIFFFEAISKVLRPMVMCFDNAQIAYENPMTLVHRLMTNSELTNVMVISLVVSSKLTPRAEENLRKFKAVFPGQVFNLIIHPLTEEAVETMLTKSLSPHIGDISSLATLIKFKTLGNPADIIDFLSKATAKSLIQFKDDAQTFEKG
ncbi:hypothetical protein DFJ73DRAFT_10038 [Zopfochytrium polystomum]|nr:hypothetical protein DFJ73DRAFT_10038 [Zopfochytrium polystomum]